MVRRESFEGLISRKLFTPPIRWKVNLLIKLFDLSFMNWVNLVFFFLFITDRIVCFSYFGVLIDHFNIERRLYKYSEKFMRFSK